MEFSLPKAIQLLERTPHLLRIWLTGLSDEWLYATEGGDSWSAYDILGHLIEGERKDWITRLKIMLGDDEDKRFEPFNRLAQFETGREKSTEQLLEEFEKLRLRNLALLESFELGEADLDRTGIHPAFGLVTARQLLSTWVVHDLSHLSQISRVMALQYHNAVGPWKEYLNLLKQKPVYYFAYASNLNPARMREEKHVFYRERKAALLKDYELVFNKQMELAGQGYGNIMYKTGAQVQGALYVVTEPEMELLKKADGWPGHYDVQEVEVWVNGRAVKALTLIACGDKLAVGLKPAKEYLAHILAGKDLMTEDYFVALKNTQTLD